MQYLLAIIAIPSLLLAQAQFRKVDPQLTHERIIAIVPMGGAGTAKNPKHPLYSDLEGLTGYTAELSDEGPKKLRELRPRATFGKVSRGFCW